MMRARPPIIPLIALLAALLSLGLAGCQQAPAVEPTEAAPAQQAAEPSPTPVAEAPAATATTPPTDTPVPTATAAPTAAPTEAPTATPTAAACLVGTWQATNFAEYMEASFEAAGEGVEVTVETSGRLLIEFTPEQMTMRSEAFNVTITLMGSTVPVEIDASGAALYRAESGVITSQVTDLDTSGSAPGAGRVVVNLATLLAATGDTAGGAINYTCEGDTMTWSGPYPVTVRFERVE